MIKGQGTMGGKPLLLLGLSGENVARLAAGEPILVRAGDLAAMGLPAMQVIVMYGRTEQDIISEIKAKGVPVHFAGEAT